VAKVVENDVHGAKDRTMAVDRLVEKSITLCWALPASVCASRMSSSEVDPRDIHFDNHTGIFPHFKESVYIFDSFCSEIEL
jgi:hypothetical protein